MQIQTWGSQCEHILPNALVHGFPPVRFNPVIHPKFEGSPKSGYQIQEGRCFYFPGEMLAGPSLGVEQ